MNNPSVMAHQFSQVPNAEIPRSSFDRSHGLKTTFDAGYLVPIYADEALPGDTFNLNMTGFARMATPIFPVMDNMFMETFFFAVPIRLIWDNWQKFNGEQTDPGDSTDYLIPTMVSHDPGGYAPQTLHDYLGIPINLGLLEHSSLWHRAYNLVFNEWFRDQNLQDSLTVDKGDGPDLPGNYVLKRRGKRHDYFTSALPWPQKGDSLILPIGDSAPVTADGTGIPEFEVLGPGSTATRLHFDSVTTPANVKWNPTSEDDGDAIWKTTALVADLSSATGSTINTLRQAFQIQKMMERDARGGTRYTEIIRSHFGVTSPDARLQRPEYLGGGSTPVNITPIAQTGETATTPQGNLAAIGTSQLQNHGFTKSFTEHCVLIGLVSVRADLTYQQGLNRMFSRSTRYDFFWPALQGLGEQAILNKEIYVKDLAHADNDLVFGYQERYAEYRYKPSMITGLFRSEAAGTLDSWHLSQDFADLPVLNESFIEEDPPLDRVIAVPSEPHFIFDSYFKLRCARPMPIYGVPGLIDHF